MRGHALRPGVVRSTWWSRWSWTILYGVVPFLVGVLLVVLYYLLNGGGSV